MQKVSNFGSLVRFLIKISRDLVRKRNTDGIRLAPIG